ncbi:MAG: hypothetical protein JRN26_04345 [Nitrososphaerota archaeon]|jgi:hypothetical protein|nr:hypothetical protein [Nitrososphaerota archaeon]MDG6932535.1 hypothetical protein [Nitrososphaerota archaeon]MDG6936094.1 hypothetical protein [Nitrososphaerota archaeon]MDG6944530.1 hypothetical protein [Nitrososphaerota archaeon]
MSNEAEIMEQIKNTASMYVSCWQNSNIIKPAPQKTGIANEHIVLDNNFTECESKYLLFKIKKNKEKLSAGKFNIEELPFEVVFNLPVILTKTLQAQNVNYDHRVFWSWVAELLYIAESGSSNDPVLTDTELTESFFLLTRLELASIGKPPTDEDVFKLNSIIGIIIDYNVREVINNKDILALNFSFPVLERILRHKCRNYVKLDGTIIQQFKIYDKKIYQTGKRINNLKHLMLLYENNVLQGSKSDTAQIINNFKSELGSIFGNNPDVYELIFRWRNDMLHGSKIRQFYHAVVMNLISLLILDSLKPDYEHLREKALKRLQMNPWSGMRLNFFPPDLF